LVSAGLEQRKTSAKDLKVAEKGRGLLLEKLGERP